MSHAPIKDLRLKSKEDLLKQLADFKKELSQLRVAQQTSSAAAKLNRIGLMRKNVARVLTVLNQKERDNLRTFYATKKTTVPKTLRAKLTHRRRLALKAEELAHKTRRARREAAKFPKKVFAVKL